MRCRKLPLALLLIACGFLISEVLLSYRLSTPMTSILSEPPCEPGSRSFLFLTNGTMVGGRKKKLDYTKKKKNLLTKCNFCARKKYCSVNLPTRQNPSSMVEICPCPLYSAMPAEVISSQLWLHHQATLFHISAPSPKYFVSPLQAQHSCFVCLSFCKTCIMLYFCVAAWS